MPVSENLKKYRKRMKLTQAQLAAKSGVSQQAISFIESARNTPSEGTLRLLSQALGCSVSDLLGESLIPMLADSLTPQENKLVEDFRLLNQQGKEYILQSMAMAVRIYISGKSDPVSGMENYAK